MFPHINEYSGTGEAICYIHGYLAGLVAAAGQSPTKAEMDKVVLGTLSDPSVRDMAVKMQTDMRPVDMLCPPREL